MFGLMILNADLVCSGVPLLSLAPSHYASGSVCLLQSNLGFWDGGSSCQAGKSSFVISPGFP
jgi:hypothetical protein